jgi:hypothetical protein
MSPGSKTRATKKVEFVVGVNLMISDFNLEIFLGA